MTKCAKCGHELREEVDPELRAVTTYPCSYCKVKRLRELSPETRAEILSDAYHSLPAAEREHIDTAADALIWGVKTRQRDARIGLTMGREIIAAVGRWLEESGNTSNG